MADAQLLEAGGLTDVEVGDRRRGGLVNRVPRRTSRPTTAILRGNLITLFNGVMGVLCVLAIWFGGWKQGLFGLVIVANAAIGTYQELRAKRTLDSLSLLNEAPVRVRRDAREESIPPDELVRDDLVLVSAGDSIVADGRILESRGLEVDESLLTGEADPVAKTSGESVRSGSFVAAGSGAYTITAIGGDGYAARLVEEAGRFALVASPLREGIRRFIRAITWIMLPVALLLIVDQARSDQSLSDAVVGAVAGIVPMVPEGLVLLTSIAFAVGVIRLGERHCLVQELPAVEGLARVDLLCLDKTGTLTEDKVEVVDVRITDETGRTALAALTAHDDSPNATITAVAAHLRDERPDWVAERVQPFSSARKWSGAAFTDHGCWVLGAPEVLLKASDPYYAEAVESTGKGLRVLALGTAQSIDPDTGPGNVSGVGLVVLRQRIRRTAMATLRYFDRQDVAVKVFSGDSAVSVGAVAAQLGIPGAEKPVDARKVPESGPELDRVLAEHTVFGRVTPQQKRRFVTALRQAGHTVAMTGDGVNDVLALKDADLGVAMGSGSPAARSVAQIVLLNDDFATLPHVVDEGRRVIGNIERVADLFLTKTVYSVLLALVIGLFALPYPFLPLHITVIGSLTIGIPAFFLALAPNAERARGGFVPRVLRFAIPAGVTAAAATFAAYALTHDTAVPTQEDQSTAALALFLVGLAVLWIVAMPPALWRVGLVAAMGAAFILILLVPWLREFFLLGFSDAGDIVTAVVCAALAIGVFVAVLRLDRWWTDRDRIGGPAQSET